MKKKKKKACPLTAPRGLLHTHARIVADRRYGTRLFHTRLSSGVHSELHRSQKSVTNASLSKLLSWLKATEVEEQA